MSVEDSGRPSPIGEEVEKKDGVKKGSNTEDGVKKGSNTEDGVKKGSNTKDGVQKGSNTELKKEKGVENVNNNNDEEGEKDKDTVNIQEDDEKIDIDISNLPVPNDEERNQCFEEGLKLDKEGKKNEALKCYLRCLVGLKEESKFALLPQCLRNIGDIYYGKNEYEKAISFIQAEKLYYENVLVDSSQLQKQIDEKAISFIQAEKLYYKNVLVDSSQLQKQIADEIAASDNVSSDDVNIDSLKATEYEQLAKLCMDEKQPQLALEYAGKATKLRQKVYGDDHPEVQKSLDYFATVYAEVGKNQYAESLTKFDPATVSISDGDTSGSSTSEPTSILRRRKPTEGDKEGDRDGKHVRFDESQVPSQEVIEREEKIAQAVLTILFVICLILFLILGVYLYCSLSHSGNCLSFRQYLQNFVLKLRFWYYQLFSGKDTKYA